MQFPPLSLVDFYNLLINLFYLIFLLNLHLIFPLLYFNHNLPLIPLQYSNQIHSQIFTHVINDFILPRSERLRKPPTYLKYYECGSAPALAKSK